jgi:hypothetical protein
VALAGVRAVALAFPAARFLGLGRTSDRLAVCHGSPKSPRIASEQLPADGWWREGKMSERAGGREGRQIL